jgi:transcriptional/translational regulatory protein YebC/TACO1
VLYENTYEAYGPGQVPMLIDTSTDNTNRTLAELRTILNKNGGKLVSVGSLSWQFEDQGRILASIKKTLKEKHEKIVEYLQNELFIEILEVEGIIDIQFIEEKDKIIIETQKEQLKAVYDFVSENFSNLEVTEAGLVKVYNQATNEVLGVDDTRKLGTLVGQIEQCNDVEEVWLGIK